MKDNKLSVSNPPESHLTVDQIYQYLEDQLPATDRHQAEMHLLDCELCNDALTGLSLTNKETTARQLFQINYQLKNRTQRRKPNTILQNLKNWGITTIILFILIIAALLVWFQVKQADSVDKPQPKPPVIQTSPSVLNLEKLDSKNGLVFLKP